MATNLGTGSKIKKQDALDYHSSGRPGKIEVVPTKAVTTARDLSLAYSPGVAEPCLEIAEDSDLSYKYTARGNLVGVISNGTAVLGLGNIGPHAGKPVMEGKGVLFKKFADIDVFDIEIDVTDVDAMVKVIQALEPTFGGINLEDIKSPECFELEERLKASMNIPVFHDDQHGTAIISGAALLNAADLAGKSLDQLRVVVSGAGASAIACANFYIALGVKRQNLMMVDTKGVIFEGRTEGMNSYKAAFAVPTAARTLADAMKGADVFLGLSAKGLVDQEMIRSMAKNPIVFALANPDPEISYPEAVEARSDIIMATGRSDYPNQVNNVLGFPFIFRGALDVRAKAITEGMKMAAAQALAQLARQEVPENVTRAYGGAKLAFGPNYIIPTPFDTRVLLWVAPAVAAAAMADGVNRVELDLEEYRERLRRSQSRAYGVMRAVVEKAKKQPVRIVFPEGNTSKVQQAAAILASDGICKPILMGPEAEIRRMITEHKIEELQGVEVIDPETAEDFERYVEEFWALRQRKGIGRREARKLVRTRSTFASMMIRDGKADGMVLGHSMSYPEALRAPLQVIRTAEGETAAGVYVVATKNEVKFFADCTVNPDPTASQLADIAARTADLARYFDIEPRVAMLSYANFGSSPTASPSKVAEATRILKAKRPDLVVDGEMQVDAALVPELREEIFPFSTLKGEANVLVFPNLDAANLSYKLLARLAGAEVIGPILLGMNKAVNVVQLGASVNDIVNLATITALKAQGEDFRF
ncbi:NADP-dependent malic enzyme [Vulgatibacter incomptus]|uniref:NADP-dependent malic enzyme n=1 Tax=Vulgatibacter incomptus TaxID=1391653 RepID=A0A0K1P997_9BACT|nr:NADP-dependent malic enzyme [Vulgatibacter incomptus]AKU90082.1 NADP-dependent malic enzyme [Vulgatibacter incomptus]